MRKKWAQRFTFLVGMLGVAGPGLVTALDDYKLVKMSVHILSGLALAFVVQSRAQRNDEPPKPTP